MSTLRLDCECRSDWVCCFRRDCPRAASIKEAQQRSIEHAQKLMGSPLVCAYPGKPIFEI
jgi:hypothetical protein